MEEKPVNLQQYKMPFVSHNQVNMTAGALDEPSRAEI